MKENDKLNPPAQKWIVFDVDDVICNFRESLYQSFKNLGIDFHWENWHDYDLTKRFNLKNDEEFYHHLLMHDVVAKSEVELEAKAVIDKFKEQGYCIGLLTARAWHKEGYKITKEFTEKYHLAVDKIVISGFHKEKKSKKMSEFEGVIKGYIDDSVHHVQDFTEHGVEAFIMTRPWNAYDKTLPRVNSLMEFQEKILKLK